MGLLLTAQSRDMFFILLASFWTNFLKGPASSEKSKGKSLSISWVIPGKLAVGPLPQPGDSAQLAAADIQVVLSLCADLEGALPEDVRDNFQCLHWFIPDSHYDIELKVADLAWAVELVHQTISNELPIYVHCLAGMQRSPTVCIAYLMRYHKLELWEAVNWLKQVRPASSPTEYQLRVVREFISQEADSP